jgi:hypothetical protein
MVPRHCHQDLLTARVGCTAWCVALLAAQGKQVRPTAGGCRLTCWLKVSRGGLGVPLVGGGKGRRLVGGGSRSALIAGDKGALFHVVDYRIGERLLRAPGSWLLSCSCLVCQHQSTTAPCPRNR